MNSFSEASNKNGLLKDFSDDPTSLALQKRRQNMGLKSIKKIEPDNDYEKEDEDGDSTVGD